MADDSSELCCDGDGKEGCVQPDTKTTVFALPKSSHFFLSHSFEQNTQRFDATFQQKVHPLQLKIFISELWTQI